jgi:Na+/proline symporter
MIGSSISGVTFVSVPGWVTSTQFTYMQMVMGFFFGYLFIAFVLLPLYYKLNLTTTYFYLKQRLGNHSHKTASSFFILSKSISAAARLYVVAIVLKTFVFDKMSDVSIPFYVIVVFIMLFIGIYTYRTGIKTIIWTDTIQTVFFISALCIITFQIASQLELNSLKDIFYEVHSSEHFQIFEFSDWHSKQHFFKQFLSGIFVVIVMTGLDQDMMQKNLSCKNIHEAQKNMLVYGFLFTPVNFLFLFLGALLLIFAQKQQISLPGLSDEMLPQLVANGYFGSLSLYVFVIGLLAAAVSSVDSAITSLTTTFYVDILGKNPTDNSFKNYKKRTIIHFGFCLLFVLLILLFQLFKDKNAIDVIYTLVSYTYGPLLGMFAFGLFTKRIVNDKYVPYIAFLSPIFITLLSYSASLYLNYHFGYELLMINGFFYFHGNDDDK